MNVVLFSAQLTIYFIYDAFLVFWLIIRCYSSMTVMPDWKHSMLCNSRFIDCRSRIKWWGGCIDSLLHSWSGPLPLKSRTALGLLKVLVALTSTIFGRPCRSIVGWYDKPRTSAVHSRSIFFDIFDAGAILEYLHNYVKFRITEQTRCTSSWIGRPHLTTYKRYSRSYVKFIRIRQSFHVIAQE